MTINEVTAIVNKAGGKFPGRVNHNGRIVRVTLASIETLNDPIMATQQSIIKALRMEEL